MVEAVPATIALPSNNCVKLHRRVCSTADRRFIFYSFTTADRMLLIAPPQSAGSLFHTSRLVSPSPLTLSRLSLPQPLSSTRCTAYLSARPTCLATAGRATRAASGRRITLPFTVAPARLVHPQVCPAVVVVTAAFVSPLALRRVARFYS